MRHSAPSALPRRATPGVLAVLFGALMAAASAADAQCAGDCDADCAVSINELIRGVGVSLGSQDVASCSALDANGDDNVTINELILAVNRALDGCEPTECSTDASPTPTPTPTVGTPPPTVTGTPPTATRTATVTPTPPVGTATPIPPTPFEGLAFLGAVARDNLTVRLTFNGVIDPASGLDEGNYEIAQVVQESPEVLSNGPEIVDVNFLLTCAGGPNAGQPCNDTTETLATGGVGACPESTCASEDRRSVVISTGAHAAVTYKLTVTGVRDTAGSAIMVFGPRGDIRNQRRYQGRPVEVVRHCPAATAAETLATGRCRPIPCTTSAECGGAPCVDVIPDCDGDGLTDDIEARGWDVSVAGSAVKRVTSNPLRVDTDADGLPDNQEFRSTSIGSVSDPRSSDTDGDGVDDYREVVLLRISPTNSDHDGDGLTDGVEDAEGYSPRDADSDGDSIIDMNDFGAGGGDPRLADLPAFDIRVGNAQVRLNYEFALRQNNTVIDTTAASQTAMLSETSSSMRTETDTRMMEWYARAGVKAMFRAGFPGGIGGSVEVTVEAGVGASGSNTVTSESVEEAVDAYNESTESGRMLTVGQTEERSVTGATVSADVRFINTGPLSMSLDDILVRMRMPDPVNPGEFITIGTLDPQGLSGPIELGTLTTMREVPFSKPLDGRGPEFVEALMRNPRSVIFDVSNFRLKSPPSDPNSYVEKEASIVANTGQVTVDFAGDGARPVQRFFASSNLGRQESVRDRNGDGNVDGMDAERVIFRPPNGEFLYPRLTEALAVRGLSFTVDPVSGQFTSVGGVASDVATRKAWIVVVADDSGTVETPLATFNPQDRVDEIYLRPGIQVWVSYLQDFDMDFVPRSAETLYGTSDADLDSDDDGLDDGQEIYESSEVTVTDRIGQPTTYRARSNPLLADSDRDGLNDLQERTVLHTATDRRDSDGDGASDQEELTDETDPLDARDFRCRPHLFRFTTSSVPDDGRFEGDVFFPFGADTQQTEPNCAVTIQRGGQSADSSGIHFGGGFAVTQVTGFTSCQLSSCQVDSCQTLGAGEIGGFCHADPGVGVHPHCTNGVPFGKPTQVTASYFVQCN